MDNKELYDQVCGDCSVLTTQAYSTSFSIGIRFLGKPLRRPVYAVYGFVRFADEIVDTFHGHDQSLLFEAFKKDTYNAIDQKISLNPILQAFQQVYHRFNIDREHVDLFLQSMEWDLNRNTYDRNGYDEYIVGSAEVVGLMCLRIFADGDQEAYNRLLPSARRLGAAFQKINFLRDLREDYQEMGRTYFPGLDMKLFNEEAKVKIESEIDLDFRAAFEGVKRLPQTSRLGVYVAYTYYLKLFQKIQNLSSERILTERIRIPNVQKIALLARSYVRHSFNNILPWRGAL
jgi:phytoene/squalene synthetase|tara:strand:+ start:635 stop:1498 length:864 start_codon:yes stop_codon:yes gene_type:complete